MFGDTDLCVFSAKEAGKEHRRMFAFRRGIGRHGGDAATDPPGTITIAVGMPMSPERRQAIVTALGPRYRVVDICVAPVASELVVVGPCSPGAIRSLSRTFPQAAVLVVERQSSNPAGPVIAALRAGALGYVVAGAEPYCFLSPHAA
jgi:hypothetical protein